MKKIYSAALFILFIIHFSVTAQINIQWNENIRTILDNTSVLQHDRGSRLPLYLWPAMDPGELDDHSAEALVRELDKRGIGIVCSWNQADREESISRGITIAKAQKKLGQRININATSLLYGFFNSDEKTAHVDENGNPFFDKSFGSSSKMGCPFTLDPGKHEIRERVEYFLKRYKEEGLEIDFNFDNLGEFISNTISAAASRSPEEWEKFGAKMDSLGQVLSTMENDSSAIIKLKKLSEQLKKTGKKK